MGTGEGQWGWEEGKDIGGTKGRETVVEGKWEREDRGRDTMEGGQEGDSGRGGVEERRRKTGEGEEEEERETVGRGIVEGGVRNEGVTRGGEERGGR